MTVVAAMARIGFSDRCTSGEIFNVIASAALAVMIPTSVVMAATAGRCRVGASRWLRLRWETDVLAAGATKVSNATLTVRERSEQGISLTGVVQQHAH